MKASELLKLIKVSYDQVGRWGRDAARIYHCVVELDGQVRMWKKRAIDLGWVEEEEKPPAPTEEPVTAQTPE